MESICAYPKHVYTQQTALQSLPKLQVQLQYFIAPCRDSSFHLEKHVLQLAAPPLQDAALLLVPDLSHFY